MDIAPCPADHSRHGPSSGGACYMARPTDFEPETASNSLGQGRYGCLGGSSIFGQKAKEIWKHRCIDGALVIWDIWVHCIPSLGYPSLDQCPSGHFLGYIWSALCSGCTHCHRLAARVGPTISTCLRSQHVYPQVNYQGFQSQTTVSWSFTIELPLENDVPYNLHHFLSFCSGFPAILKWWVYPWTSFFELQESPRLLELGSDPRWNAALRSSPSVKTSEVESSTRPTWKKKLIYFMIFRRTWKKIRWPTCLSEHHPSLRTMSSNHKQPARQHPACVSAVCTLGARRSLHSSTSMEPAAVLSTWDRRQIWGSEWTILEPKELCLDMFGI